MRWLLSVIPSAMIFDDHDVHDDWNTSAAWRRDYAAKPWWPERIRSAYMTYWIYQHIGNLSPAELAKNELWQQLRSRAITPPCSAISPSGPTSRATASSGVTGAPSADTGRRDRLAQRPGAQKATG